MSWKSGHFPDGKSRICGTGRATSAKLIDRHGNVATGSRRTRPASSGGPVAVPAPFGEAFLRLLASCAEAGEEPE
jgi:hypothetical protein